MQKEIFDGACVLITGGTGSFGGVFVNSLLQTQCKEIRVFSRDELKQDIMRSEMKDSRVKFFIGDVTDPTSLENAVAGVDYIFHAAALKQVPSCEFFPISCVKTNVLGTHNVLREAQKKHVSKVVVLSTDKAVYPINAMGMSKALMEKTMVAESRVGGHITKMCATRYGNVIASRGSVIPIFIDRIFKGLPLQVTDPRMTRFLMSLQDAVELVEFAFMNGGAGEVFVQKAPATDIMTLARALMEIVGVEVPIELIGKRHGEKLHETLVGAEELSIAHDLTGFFKIPRDSRDLNYSMTVSEQNDADLDKTYSSSSTVQLNVEQTKDLLLRNAQVKDLLKGHMR